MLGLLQGVSELFPVSSLGHSVILPNLFGWNIHQNAPYFLTFLVALHLATALVLLGFFWRDWVRIVKGLGRSLRDREIARPRREARLAARRRDDPGRDPRPRVPGLAAEAVRLAGVRVASSSPSTACCSSAPSCCGGALPVVAEDDDERIARTVGWWQSFTVGAAQAIALIPGFSRSGASMGGGLLVGLSHKDAARFAFLLATPIILAAAVLKLPDLAGSQGNGVRGPALVGALCSAVTAYLAVRFLMRYFETRTLTPFAIYCVCAGTASAIYFAVSSRPVCSARPRRRLASAGVSAPRSSRQLQFPFVIPGRFIRASLPRPSTSCAGTIASAARDEYASSISPQLGSRGSRPVAARCARREAGEPAGSGVGVVRARVGDRVASVVRRVVRVALAAAEGPEENDHPREAELVAQPVHRRRDVAEVLGDQRQIAELALDRAEELGPGTGPPAAALRRRVPRRNRPVRDEAAEVVDPADVDELERAPEALAPPAVAGRTVDGPVVERVPPALAGRAERVGRRAGDLAAREQLRPAGVIGAVVGDVDRHVADQPDAALRGVAAQRPPLPLEAHLVGERLRAGELRPAAGPVRMARDEVLDLAGRDPRRRPGEQLRARPRTPTASGTASGTRRAARAAAPATTTGRRPRASRRTGTPRGRACRTAARSDGGGCRPSEGAPRFDPSSSVRLGACPSRRRPPRGSRSRRSRRRSTAAATRSSARSATRSR